MRIAFFTLLALNLVYMAWAGWIDKRPTHALVSQSNPALPQLAMSADQAASNANEALPAAATEKAGSVPPTAAAEPIAASSGRCVSVGPFSDLSRVAKAAALLKDRGFGPKQRAEPGENWDGYWVYVGGLKTAADERKVLKALEQAGLSDARAMPGADDERRVSVGLFSARDGAEKRARSVNRLGFPAEIAERKQTGTMYWVDIELASPDRTVPTEGLLSQEEGAGRLEVRVCPATASASPLKPGAAPREGRPNSKTADAGSSPPG